MAAGGRAGSGRNSRKFYLVNHWSDSVRYLHAVMAIIGGIVLENIRRNMGKLDVCFSSIIGKVRWRKSKRKRVWRLARVISFGGLRCKYVRVNEYSR
jgi:hypothetical protein